jgi:hypothetical protein
VYTSGKFQSFLKTHHIQHETTSRHTPQEIGHAEKTVDIDQVNIQSMLSESKGKGYVWGECTSHADMLQNVT